MPVTLRNNLIELGIDLPSENYQQARFDWSSKLVALKFKGTSIVTTEKLASTNSNDFGSGFYNEFGIDTALGFDEALSGEWFHKIGVGALKKSTDEYDFNHAYEIRPSKFSFKFEEDVFESVCSGELINGYAYELSKKVKLLENGFRIDYELKNTGHKTINTDEYCHNFIAIDNDLINENYVLSFPFELNETLFDEFVNPADVVLFKDNKISFNGSPLSDIFFSNLTYTKHKKASWNLTHKSAKIAIEEITSFTTNKINVWGCGHVVSPELFFNIHVKAGNTIRWYRKFNIYNTP